MTTIEIIQRLIPVHNRMIQISVSGDSAVLMGDSIRDLRFLLQELEKDTIKDPPEEAKRGDSSG